MKTIKTPVIEVVTVDVNDILTTSLSVADGGTSGAGITTAGAPAREGVFSAPAEQQNAGGIW